MILGEATENYCGGRNRIKYPGKWQTGWLESLIGIHQYFIAHPIYVRDKLGANGFKGRDINYVNNEKLLALKAINAII